MGGAITQSAGALFGETNAQSLNWAGYVVTGSPGSVTSVQTSFIVPSVSPSHGTTYVALWAGIDGYNSGTVEQAGILVESTHNSVIYRAWTEFYPAAPTYASWTPEVKNVITVTVSVSGSDVTATVNDVSTGRTYTQSVSASGYQLNSAEWIVERPSTSAGLTTLANFGTAYFGTAHTSSSINNYATVSGVSGAIGSFSTAVAVTMVSSTGGTLAYPTPLSTDYASFTVIYASSSGGSGGGHHGKP